MGTDELVAFQRDVDRLVNQKPRRIQIAAPDQQGQLVGSGR